MAEIFNFSSIEEKKSSRSLSYKKSQKRQNYRKGQYSLAHFWENWWLDQNFFFTKLVDIYHRKNHRKNDGFTNGGDIKLLNFGTEKKEKKLNIEVSKIEYFGNLKM